jgi:hypothetical protein
VLKMVSHQFEQGPKDEEVEVGVFCLYLLAFGLSTDDTPQ